MNRRVRLFLVGSAGGAVLAAAFFWLRAQDWPKHQRLMREGRPVQGIVTGKGLGAPDNVNYTYSVEGILHSGIGKAGKGTLPFDQLDIDDGILVFYAASDPDVSTLGEPREHIRSLNRLLALGLLIAAPVLGYFLSRELKTQGP